MEADNKKELAKNTLDALVNEGCKMNDNKKRPAYKQTITELTVIIGDGCASLQDAAKRIQEGIEETPGWKEKLDRFQAASVDYDIKEAVRRIESGAALLHRTVGTLMYVRGGKDCFKW